MYLCIVISSFQFDSASTVHLCSVRLSVCLFDSDFSFALSADSPYLCVDFCSACATWEVSHSSSSLVFDDCTPRVLALPSDNWSGRGVSRVVRWSQCDGVSNIAQLSLDRLYSKSSHGYSSMWVFRLLIGHNFFSAHSHYPYGVVPWLTQLWASSIDCYRPALRDSRIFWPNPLETCFEHLRVIDVLRRREVSPQWQWLHYNWPPSNSLTHIYVARPIDIFCPSILQCFPLHEFCLHF